MKIQLLVDNPESWFVPFAIKLKDELYQRGFDVSMAHAHTDVEEGDILFILSCEGILKEATLKKNRHNLVVHGSDLPKGRGWSPLTWEVLEGRQEFSLSLLEASKQVDAGKVYLKSKFRLEGHELNEEMKEIQAEEILRLVHRFLDIYPNVRAEDQIGEPTYYPRRTPSDSALDIMKSIEEQFNLLRIVDNERYPAYFIRNGFKYVLKIYKEKTE